MVLTFFGNSHMLRPSGLMLKIPTCACCLYVHMYAQATVLTAMIAPETGLLKGGTFEFIAGFVDKDGNVLCPTNAIPETINDPPTVAEGALPLVKCGEYKLKVRRQ
jgi:hypothetical protein